MKLKVISRTYSHVLLKTCTYLVTILCTVDAPFFYLSLCLTLSLCLFILFIFILYFSSFLYLPLCLYLRPFFVSFCLPLCFLVSLFLFLFSLSSSPLLSLSIPFFCLSYFFYLPFSNTWTLTNTPSRTHKESIIYPPT